MVSSHILYVGYYCHQPSGQGSFAGSCWDKYGKRKLGLYFYKDVVRHCFNLQLTQEDIVKQTLNSCKKQEPGMT